MTRTVEDMYPPNIGGNRIADPKRSLLVPNHSAAAAANVSIAHAQLRHLISCPCQRGVVYYVNDKSILERDVLKPAAPSRRVIDIEFAPTCFAATAVSTNPTTILFAAGSYTSDLHLSLHTFPSTPQTPLSPSAPPPASPKLIWCHPHRLRGRSEIVNSILFTSASLTDDTVRSPSDIRMAVSGNDAAVKLFEVAMEPNVKEEQRLQDCGNVKLETPVNHLSFSPDGRTLLCVGDTPKAYLFNVSPGSTVTFSLLATYTLPLPPRRTETDHGPPSFTNPSPNISSQACFSTAWSSDGLKFVVVSQEGQLCVWDVRSAHPVLTYWTAFRRNSSVAARGRRSEWEWEDLAGQFRPSDDASTNGPDSGIRNVTFSTGEGGRELLVFMEHTTNVHVIDARTFDPATHCIIRFPDLSFAVPSPSPSLPPLAPADRRAPSPIAPIGDDALQQSDLPVAIWRFGPRSRSPSRSPPPPRSRSRSRPRSPRVEVRDPPQSRSRTPSNGTGQRQIASRSPDRRDPEGPVVIFGRPRSPSPPARIATAVITPQQRSQSPPSINVPMAVQSEPNVHWQSNELDTPESHSRLDADGDLIQGSARQTGLLQGGWTGRIAVPPHVMRTWSGGRSEGPMPLEAVAEGGEPPAPPPPQRPTQLAGMCFDPTGGWLYVASETGIVEWRVREREEGNTCWGSGAWA